SVNRNVTVPRGSDTGGRTRSTIAAPCVSNSPLRTMCYSPLRTMEAKAARSTRTGFTLTEYAVLGLLGHLGPREVSGYDLKKFADQSIGYLWAPSKTQLYAVLGRLVSQGLATRRAVAQSHRPDKQLYRLNEAGAEVLREWLERPEDETDP